MARKTAKPAVRIDDEGHRWMVTVYKVVNRTRAGAGHFYVEPGDLEAIQAGLDKIILPIRQALVTPEK